MSSPLRFNKALVIGANEPIGKALAKYFVSIGKTVVVAGYPEADITAARHEIGAHGTLVFDAGSSPEDIADFAAAVAGLHPTIDCLVNAADTEAALDLANLPAADPGLGDAIAYLDRQLVRNVRGPLHLTLRLLPLLRRAPGGARIVNVGSLFGFVPTGFPEPGYGASRAWTHAWSMTLRTQLRRVSPEVRVVEIVAPVVGPAWGMTPDAFAAEVAAKLQRGDETFGVGPAADVVQKWFQTYGPAYEAAEASWKPPPA